MYFITSPLHNTAAAEDLSGGRHYESNPTTHFRDVSCKFSENFNKKTSCRKRTPEQSISAVSFWIKVS